MSSQSDRVLITACRFIDRIRPTTILAMTDHELNQFVALEDAVANAAGRDRPAEHYDPSTIADKREWWRDWAHRHAEKDAGLT